MFFGLFRVRSLKSEIHKEEVKQKDKQTLKRKLKEQEPFQTKRLGTTKYPFVVLCLMLIYKFNEMFYVLNWDHVKKSRLINPLSLSIDLVNVSLPFCLCSRCAFFMA